MIATKAPIRGAGFLAYGTGDLGQPHTQTGLQAFAATTKGNWVAFNPDWSYNTNSSPGTLSNSGQGPTDAELVTAIGWAHAAGLKVMLKPMIDPLSTGPGAGQARSGLDPGASNIAGFMSSQYLPFITHYATLAAQNNVEMLCIMTELYGLVNGAGGSGAGNYLSYWTGSGGVIPTVKAAYSGKLTAAGPVPYTTLPNAFWASLDYLGMDFYPSLIPTPVVGTSDLPTLQANMATFTNHMATFSAANGNKPVLLTETGFVNNPASAFAGGGLTGYPGSRPANGAATQNNNQLEQAAAAAAWVQGLEGPSFPWYAGMFFWGWFCYYDQQNPNDGGFNQYGLPAAAALGGLWNASRTASDGASRYRRHP